LILM